MTFRLLIISVMVWPLMGCGKMLENFVRIKRPDGGAVVPFEGRATIKISPGNTIATSTDVAMSAHVTITDRPLTGGDVSARVSISRHRGPQFQ